MKKNECKYKMALTALAVFSCQSISFMPAYADPDTNDAAPADEPRVHYRLKNDVGTRHINGVSVRTNPDGSIETTDGESKPVPISRSGSTTAHHAVHTKTVTKTAPKPV